MVEGSEQAPVVVPVHPFEGGELDCFAVTPRAAPERNGMRVIRLRQDPFDTRHDGLREAALFTRVRRPQLGFEQIRGQQNRKRTQSAPQYRDCPASSAARCRCRRSPASRRVRPPPVRRPVRRRPDADPGDRAGTRNRAAARWDHPLRSWAASAVKASFVRKRSSTLRANAASAAACRCGLASTSSTRRSKPQASTHRRAVSIVGLDWPVSYRATAEGGIRARLASSARVRPARSRASRISTPRVRDMCIGARRNPLPDDCLASLRSGDHELPARGAAMR